MSNFDDLGGLLVCEVAVQEPFVYTKVYALETYRFLSSNTIGFHPNSESAQAHYTFLNECDHIKVIRTICICFHSTLNFLFSPPPQKKNNNYIAGTSSLAFVYLRLPPAQLELFCLRAAISFKTSVSSGQLSG